MEANRILLGKKYARIISGLAKEQKISLEAAMRIFYESDTFQDLKDGRTELHCCSDAYIVDELLIEIEYKNNNNLKNTANRLKAYQDALTKIITKV